MSELGRRNVRGETLDMAGDAMSNIAPRLAKADVVVSLLPAPMHAKVAELCIDAGTPLCTASYVNDEMKALSEKAQQAGVPILCEMGLDPGMDHMSAMKVSSEISNR